MPPKRAVPREGNVVDEIHLKYLDFGAIGGRGGVVRFYLLSHKIPFTEEVYDPATEWPAVKAKLIESGENPAGTVPVVRYNEQTLTQHVAIMREISKIRGLCIGGDHGNDAVADQYQGLRDKWVEAAFAGGDKAAFRKHVAEQLKVLNALYDKYAQHDVFLKLGSDGMPLWGDYCVYSLTRDLILTGFVAVDDLPPRVAKMYDALGAVPEIANWIAEKEAQADEKQTEAKTEEEAGETTKAA